MLFIGRPPILWRPSVCDSHALNIHEQLDTYQYTRFAASLGNLNISGSSGQNFSAGVQSKISGLDLVTGGMGKKEDSKDDKDGKAKTQKKSTGTNAGMEKAEVCGSWL